LNLYGQNYIMSDSVSKNTNKADNILIIIK